MPRFDRHAFRAVFTDDPLNLREFRLEGRGYGSAGAYLKGTVSHSPFRLCNELICGEIGRFLRLPIPPMGITVYLSENETDKERIKSQFLFSSLDFNFERDSLPAIEPDICVQKMPSLCAGILLFDILIANPDRRPQNLWSDNVGFPTQMLVFDHDVALFGIEGIERLAMLREDLGLTHLDSSRMQFHCFLERIAERSLLDEWFNRAYSIPPWMLDDLCDSARKYGIRKEAAVEAREFLYYRSRNLEQLVLANKSKFSGISDWEPPTGSLF